MEKKADSNKAEVIKEIEIILKKYNLYLIMTTKGSFELLTEPECKERELL